ncbi:MAG: hypothetical protein IH881_15815 [Myxococcales bacterium]|nr:hypothetical protein [Myxococcales bacterium]
MTRRLQQTSFDRSHYERPDREWVCGRTGHACPLGPDNRGECITTHECSPYNENDRWKCSRQGSYGGECADGPLPDGVCCNAVSTCQPRRSVRALRGRAVRWAVVMTVGTLAIALGADRGLWLVFPGPVTHQHGTIENDCASCHDAGTGGLAHWISTAMMGQTGASDSQRCLECHNLGPSSMIAHSLPATDLAQTTERLNQRELETSRPLRFILAGLGPGLPLQAGNELACAVCHQEHRGTDHQLAALSNNQCQACHLVQFDRFSQGHPPLGVYPYGRRTRIIFDHKFHRDEIYEDEERDFSCVDCHAPEATGRTMTVMPFETSCASCHEHEEDVYSSGKRGIAFINLPGIDGRRLRRAGIDIGQWPRVAKPVTPSPFVDFLLVGDDRLSDQDRQTVAGLGTAQFDVSNRTHAEQQAIGRYAWSLKLLLRDIRSSGHRAIESRLRNDRVMGDGDLPMGLLSNLAGGLQRETFNTAIDGWFPDLAKEVAVFLDVTRNLDQLQDMNRNHWAEINRQLRDLARQRAGSRGATASVSSSGEKWVREGGWYQGTKDASIRYRSSGHADPFVRAWFDLSGSFAHTGNPAGDAASAAENLFAGLRDSEATGRCARCHSIDPANSSYGSPGTTRKVNWKPFTPEANQHLPTEFRHQPHFSLDNADRCDTCHRMREFDEEEFNDAYDAEASPEGHVLNFEPIALSVCGGCHTPNAAGDDCVACHNYHLGKSTPMYLTATSGKRAGDADSEEEGDSGGEGDYEGEGTDDGDDSDE